MSDDLDIDARSVTVVWVGDEYPEVLVGGCSLFEAAGMLRAALQRVERTAERLLVYPSDWDFEEDEEDDE